MPVILAGSLALVWQAGETCNAVQHLHIRRASECFAHGYQCLHTCESEETAVRKCSVGILGDQQRSPLFASGSHNTLVCLCRLALRAQQLVASNSRQKPQPTYRIQEWDGLKMAPSTKMRRLRSVAPCPAMPFVTLPCNVECFKTVA